MKAAFDAQKWPLSSRLFFVTHEFSCETLCDADFCLVHWSSRHGSSRFAVRLPPSQALGQAGSDRHATVEEGEEEIVCLACRVPGPRLQHVIERLTASRWSSGLARILVMASTSSLLSLSKGEVARARARAARVVGAIAKFRKADDVADDVSLAVGGVIVAAGHDVSRARASR